MRVTRRGLLIGGAAGAGLVLAWAIWPRDYDLAPYRDDKDTVFGAFLRIARDGSVIIGMPLCEMGHGISTVLAQVVAEELGADWRTVALVPAPPAPVFANTVLASQWAEMLMPAGLPVVPGPDNLLIRRLAAMNDFVVTAADTEIANYELPYRQAAAGARALLCQAAAARWGVDWEVCEARDGFVAYGNEQVRFADLLEDALGYDIPDPVPLRATQPGNARAEPVGDAPPFARLDLPAKVDGSAGFVADIRLPDMVFAAIREGPGGAFRLVSVDQEPAKRINGLIEVVTGERWVAAVATNWWAADRAVSALKPVFAVPPVPAETSFIEEALEKALTSGEGARLHKQGDVDEGFLGRPAIAARYSVSAAMHGTLETGSVLARLIDDKLELWVASQAPAVARRRAAEALGLSQNDVTLYPVMAGGSFDRRLDDDLVVAAAILAKKMRRPVQLTRSRNEESLRDPVRTPVLARLAATLDEAGNIGALSVKLACPPTSREFAQRFFHDLPPEQARRNTEGEFDAMAVAGASLPYAIPHWAVDHYPADIGITTGRWRGNSASYGCFVTECFIDEMAAERKREPLSYRVQMLGKNVRLARCLSRVAALAEWDGGINNSGQGVACCALGGGFIAVIASVQRDGSAGNAGIRVDRLSAVVDAGRIINHDIALQQIEGGMIWGMAMAMGSATGFTDGRANAVRLRDLALPRLADTPELRVEFIDSLESPAGLGELGVPAVAPAIANALHSATGIRFRQLPLLSEGL